MAHVIKKGSIKVPTQPKDYDLQATGLVFKSYDNQIALEFNVTQQDGAPADLLGATLRLLMYVYDEADGTVTKEPVPFITKNLITESFLNGHVKYILPEALKAYSGVVETYVYIEYPDGSTSDNLGFTFRMKRSAIDGLAQDKADYFIEDFKQLLDGVKQEATDAVNEVLAKVDSSTAKMQELEQRIDEQTEIFNNADVYNKAEIEDKLEPFALRTDIDTLEIKKADKTDVNQLATDKADKTSLAQTTQRVDGLADGKVDKGGAGQVTIGMLSQEVKTAMTGGSVAVVGKDAVSTTNIVDRSITDAKLKANVTGGLFIHPDTNDRINFDFINEKIEIPNGYSYRLGYKYYSPTGRKVIDMTANGSQALVLDLSALVYRCVAVWATTELSSEDVVVAIFNKTRKTVSINTEYKINGDYVYNPNDLSGSSFYWSNSKNQPINFDFGNEKIIIPGRSQFIAKEKAYYYTDWNPNGEDVAIDISNLNNAKLIFDLRSKSFSAVTFNAAMTGSQLVLCSFNKSEKRISQDDLYVINGSKDTVPKYVTEEITRVTNNILDNKNPEMMVISWITDTHNCDNLVDQFVDFTKQGLADLCVHTGDITYELEEQKMLSRFDEIKRQYSAISPSLLLNRGNHDSDGTAATDGIISNVHFTERLIMNDFVRKNCIMDDQHEGHYYYDDKNRKIRVISLNMASASTDTVKRNGITAHGLKWLSTVALNFEETDWEVIVFGHSPIWTGVFEGALGARVEDVARILEAFNTGGTYIDSYGLQENVTYSDANRLIGYFCGHIHMDTLVKREELSFTMITSMAMQPSNGAGGIEGVNVFSRTSGTVTENAFDNILIDQRNRKVYLKRFGAGVDREFYY